MDDLVRTARQMALACPATLVRKAARFITGVFDEALRPLEIQTSQANLLVAVATFGEAGAGMGALADALLMERTTLTRNVRPLEKAGLVRVARSPDDARARLVLLTPAGERLIARIPPLWEQAQRQLRQSIGAQKMKSLHGELAEFVKLAAQSRGAG